MKPLKSLVDWAQSRATNAADIEQLKKEVMTMEAVKDWVLGLGTKVTDAVKGLSVRDWGLVAVGAGVAFFLAWLF